MKYTEVRKYVREEGKRRDRREKTDIVTSEFSGKIGLIK